MLLFLLAIGLVCLRPLVCGDLHLLMNYAFPILGRAFLTYPPVLLFRIHHRFPRLLPQGIIEPLFVRVGRQLQGVVLLEGVLTLGTVVGDAVVSALKVLLQVSTKIIECGASLGDLADPLVIPALFGVCSINL